MKKLLSLSLVVIMVLTTFFCLPYNAFASDSGEINNVENPIYSGEKITYNSKKFKSQDWTVSKAPEFRDALVLRQEKYEFEFPSETMLSKSEMKNSINQFFMNASSDSISVSSVDGDYIRWQLDGYSMQYVYNDGKYSVDMDLYYNDSAEEERETDKAIKEYLSSLDLNSYSDYELLKEFHDHILDVCDYNYYNMNANYNYSCYGVFKKGKAVCQGYALAFYRLCKEVGFDVRISVSDPNEGCHAWNLVRLDNEYYYVDTTWDDDLIDQYKYFLVDYETLQTDDKNFEHKLYDEYFDNDDYYNKYEKFVSDDCWDSSSKSIANCQITVDYNNPSNVSVKDGTKALQNTIDYYVNSDGNSFAKIIGANDYNGTYSVRKKSINNIGFTQNTQSICFSNDKAYLNFYSDGLSEGTDYIVSVHAGKNNVGSYTAIVQGIGKYTGIQYFTYDVFPADINTVDIKLSFTKAEYFGLVQIPNVIIDGLTKNVDYSVRSDNSKDPGKYTIYVDGIGNYSGTTSLNYYIYPESTCISANTLSETSINVSWDSSAGVSGYKVEMKYNGTWSEVRDVYNTYNSTTIDGLLPNTIYTFRVRGYTVTDSETLFSNYSNEASATTKEIETTTAANSSSVTTTATAATTPTSTASSKATKISKPSKVKITKLKTSKKTITVYWKKMSASGFQVQYSTSSKFKKAKTVTVKGSSKTSAKIKSLKKGKKYYVRVRAYKTVNGKKYYGSWSTKKSITVK
ncbi:MAG: fibronectin type III domain-containing protein [Eubacterium sp.]